MSSLNSAEKVYLEKILGMQGGYVLDYTDETFGSLFRFHGSDIHGERYGGQSKAKKLRLFWEKEPNAVVTPVLTELLDYYVSSCENRGDKIDLTNLAKCRSIISRINPRSVKRDAENFVNEDIVAPSIHEVDLEGSVRLIIEQRLQEIEKTLKAKAYLSTIILCGSVLEAVLLGVSNQNSEKSKESYNKLYKGKVAEGIINWRLEVLIDVAFEAGFLRRVDVKKFSHVLRKFRNYIHPYQEMRSNFTPDEHTARICHQVLKACFADLARKR